MQKLIFILVLMLSGAVFPALAHEAPPKLILTLVIDQFRADQLERWKESFTKDGFNRLINEGAVFPFSEYPALQNMTCPGHAMILTGSTPAHNGIVINEWIDPVSKKEIYCVEDDEFGFSPRKLQGSTLGDEIKMRWPESKVVGVALKDRAAILLTGRSADAAYWFSGKNFSWDSSPYYKKASKKLLHHQVQGAAPAGATFTWMNHTLKMGSAESYSAPWGIEQTFAVAKKAFEEHGLAQGSSPDLLAVSISSHDVAGHQYGPESAETADLMKAEDQGIADFMKWLDQKVPGGLANVWILLTADHGGAPTIERATSFNLDAGRIPPDKVSDELNSSLKKKFGACKESWIAGVSSFNFYLSPSCLAKSKASRATVENFAKEKILTFKGVAHVVTKSEVENGRFPPPPFDDQIRKSYFPGISGDLILIPKPFWFEVAKNNATHMTSYSYDRMVPMIFWGKPFRQGTWAKAQVVDAAPTLAFALRILPPALSQGKVLEQALKEVPQ